jgi:predicted nucleic acid-binding protein
VSSTTVPTLYGIDSMAFVYHAEIASELRAIYTLRTPDAIHLATALKAGAAAFVSQDRRLKGMQPKGMKVLPLSDLF